MLRRTKPDYSASHSARLTEDVLADERDDYDYLMQTSTVWQLSINIFALVFSRNFLTILYCEIITGLIKITLFTVVLELLFAKNYLFNYFQIIVSSQLFLIMTNCIKNTTTYHGG